MRGAFYKLGASALLQRLGLQKPEKHTARNVALGGIAASPFLGLIGQKPIIHDPFTNPDIPRVKNLRDLEKVVKPGDILAMTTETPEGWKLPQLFGGTEWHHGGIVPSAEPYRGKLRPRVLSDSPLLHNLGFTEGENIAKLRKKLPWFTPGLDYADYSAVVLRPKTPLTAEQLKELEKAVLTRSMRKYETKKGITNWLRDIFIPKLDVLAKHRAPVMCEGNVCSTLPAQAYYQATGRPLVSNVVPHETMTADFLRSPELRPVAARISDKLEARHLSPRALKAIRYGGRAALGLGLAGGAYALHEDPLLVSSLAGAALTPTLIRKLIKQRMLHTARAAHRRALTPASIKKITRAAGKELPHIDPGAIMNLIGDTSKKSKMLLGRALLRTVPTALAGGAATYLAARGAKKLIRGE